MCAEITEAPLWFVRSLMNAKIKTTTNARKPPTAARALAVVRSNPSFLDCGSYQHWVIAHEVYRWLNGLHDYGGCVSGKRAPGGKHAECAEKVWPAFVVGDCLPNHFQWDALTLGSGSPFSVFQLKTLLEDILVRRRETNQAWAQERARLIGRSRKKKQQQKPHDHGEDTFH